jgi:dUTP pyrophosphatase
MKMKVMRRGGKLPALASEGAVGFDCFADADVEIGPGEKCKVPLGFAMEVPSAHLGMLTPRSGKGTAGLVLANTVGIIDRDYRGEVFASMWNVSEDPIRIRNGESVCQLLIVPCWTPATIEVVNELSQTERGDGGFGSAEGKV